METNNEQTNQTISYDTVEAYFLEEASSLIPDDILQKTLKTEQLRFDNAAILGISNLSLVGNNTARHCKDLLRKNQPVPFLYTLLCFLSEVSILMLIFGVIYSFVTALSTESSFFTSFTYLYELIFFSGFSISITALRKQLNNTLALPFSKEKPDDTEIQSRKKRLKRKRIFTLLLIVAGMAILIALVAHFDLQDKYTINITGCFFAYVLCMLLSGIHNVIFNSHIIPFLTIGGLRLIRKSNDVISTACKTYLDAKYLQILSLSGKTLEAAHKNPELPDKLRKTVYAHAVTKRVYCVLALFLLVVLDIICIVQLQTGLITVALLVFFFISILLTVIFLIAILAANAILKKTKSY